MTSAFSSDNVHNCHVFAYASNCSNTYVELIIVLRSTCTCVPYSHLHAFRSFCPRLPEQQMHDARGEAFLCYVIYNTDWHQCATHRGHISWLDFQIAASVFFSCHCLGRETISISSGQAVSDVGDLHMTDARDASHSPDEAGAGCPFQIPYSSLAHVNVEMHSRDRTFHWVAWLEGHGSH